MTTPALEAFNGIVGELHVDHPTGDETFHMYPMDKEDVELVRTALANAPEVVDIEWLKRSWVIRDTGRETVEYFMYRFPNGLKITAAPNGGA